MNMAGLVFFWLQKECGMMEANTLPMISPMAIETKQISRSSFIIASVTIAFMMVFLWQAAWPVPFAELHQEKGLITDVSPHLSWVDVDIETGSGLHIACSGRSASKTCSEAAFLAAQEKGGAVQVWHDGSRPYQVIGSDGAVILPYMAFAQKRLFVLCLEALFLGMFSVLAYRHWKESRIK